MPEKFWLKDALDRAEQTGDKLPPLLRRDEPPRTLTPQEMAQQMPSDKCAETVALGVPFPTGQLAFCGKSRDSHYSQNSHDGGVSLLLGHEFTAPVV